MYIYLVEAFKAPIPTVIEKCAERMMCMFTVLHSRMDVKVHFEFGLRVFYMCTHTLNACNIF